MLRARRPPSFVGGYPLGIAQMVIENGILSSMTLLGKHSKSQLRAFGEVGTLGLEIALSAVVGFYGGQWLDERLKTEPWFKWFGLFVGVAAGVRAIVRVVRWVKEEMKSSSEDSK